MYYFLIPVRVFPVHQEENTSSSFSPSWGKCFSWSGCSGSGATICGLRKWPWHAVDTDNDQPWRTPAAQWQGVPPLACVSELYVMKMKTWKGKYLLNSEHSFINGGGRKELVFLRPVSHGGYIRVTVAEDPREWVHAQNLTQLLALG